MLISSRNTPLNLRCENASQVTNGFRSPGTVRLTVCKWSHCPRYPGSHILHPVPEDQNHVSVRVVAVQRPVRAEYSLGGSRGSQVEVPTVVSDGRWHRILLILNSKQITLQVDECENTAQCEISDIVAGPYYYLNTNTPIYLGGVDYPYNYLPESLYEGCIREFTVDGEILDFSRLVSGVQFSEGCSGCDKECTAPLRCLPGSGAGKSCQCPWGRTGRDCSTSSPSITLNTGNCVQFCYVLTLLYICN
eukprot:sb/3468836/